MVKHFTMDEYRKLVKLLDFVTGLDMDEELLTDAFALQDKLNEILKDK